MDLKDKTALIPGASRLIGRAIAEKFGQHGAKLILPVFDWPDSIEEMKEDFSNKGYNFHTIQADLRTDSGAKSVERLIEVSGGNLHYLINNIERGGMPIVHGSYDLPHNEGQWEIEFDTTVKAKWLLYKHCKNYLKKAKDSAVVNISSIAGLVGRSGPAAVFFNDGYSAANRAVDSFTLHWAKEAGSLYRVNGVVLGLVEGRHGEQTRGWSALSDSAKQANIDRIPLGRTGKAEEVAEAVYFLAVTASYMTGSIVKMDGGYTLGGDTIPPMPAGIL